MKCLYCAQQHDSQIYALYKKDGTLIGHADYRCLFGTYHPEWWMAGGKILVISRMPYRCVLIDQGRV